MIKRDPNLRLTLDDLGKLTFGQNEELVVYMKKHHREEGCFVLAFLW
jgi:hypothetical protein